MQISRKSINSVLLASVLAFGANIGSGQIGYAFDPEKTFKPDEEPRTILRFGLNAFKSGNMADALGAFRFGAEKNDLASQWKLARMLEMGHGVEKNDIAAYNLYAKIANRFSDRAPNRMQQTYVANAVVALGLYSLNGLKGTNIKPNPRRAEDHFSRAAALYKYPEAQFQLGVLYRSGLLGVKQPRSAARWFRLAARKGHPTAQAELGEMLFHGEGVRRSPVRGLVYLTRAAANSARKGIRERREAIFSQASPEQVEAALEMAELLERKNAKPSKTIALETVSPAAAAAASAVSHSD